MHQSTRSNHGKKKGIGSVAAKFSLLLPDESGEKVTNEVGKGENIAVERLSLCTYGQDTRFHQHYHGEFSRSILILKYHEIPLSTHHILAVVNFGSLACRHQRPGQPGQ